MRIIVVKAQAHVFVPSAQRVGMVSLKPGVGAERVASYPGVDE
jgi:hypothetical protein